MATLSAHCPTAASLARRGWQVQVLDAATAPAGGASGLPLGLFAPHLSPDDNVFSRVSRSGVRAMLQQSQALLQPGLAILDETDSGLDIDALKSVADGVNALRSPERSFVVITHYQRLLDYIKPDVVHVLAEGRIVKSGGPELALELEAHGYDFLKDRVVREAAK